MNTYWSSVAVLVLVSVTYGDWKQNEESTDSGLLDGDHICIRYESQIVWYKETYVAKRAKLRKCSLWNRLEGKCSGRYYVRYISVIGYRMVNKTREIPKYECCQGYQSVNGTCKDMSNKTMDKEPNNTVTTSLTLLQRMPMLMKVLIPAAGIILIIGIVIGVVIGIVIWKNRPNTCNKSTRNQRMDNSVLDNPIYNMVDEQPYDKLRLCDNPESANTYDSLRVYQDVD